MQYPNPNNPILFQSAESDYQNDISYFGGALDTEDRAVQGLEEVDEANIEGDGDGIWGDHQQDMEFADDTVVS